MCDGASNLHPLREAARELIHIGRLALYQKELLEERECSRLCLRGREAEVETMEVDVFVDGQ